MAEELVRFGREVGQGSGDQEASPEEEKEREEESSLPIAIGEAVDFAEGEDPFDDSTDSSALEDEDEYSEGD